MTWDTSLRLSPLGVVGKYIGSEGLKGIPNIWKIEIKKMRKFGSLSGMRGLGAHRLTFEPLIPN